MNLNFLKNYYRIALELFRRLDRRENVLVSPLSVITALSMLGNGAAGQTLRDMENFLAPDMSRQDFNQALSRLLYELKSDGEDRFTTADSIWVPERKGLKQDFIDENRGLFGAEVREEPFSDETVRLINDWVNEHTEGMIPEIIESVEAEAGLYLIDALAFIGRWESPFTKNDVAEETFTDIDGNRARVQMMSGTERTYIHADGVSGFVKRYRDTRFAFCAFLPDDPSAFDSFLQNLSAEALLRLMDAARDRDVEIKLPKFDVDYATILNMPLKDMNIGEAFTENADFSNMSDDPVTLGDVIHKTHITVDEEGTRAAAVTAIMAKGAFGFGQEKPRVYLDRPFVYALFDMNAAVPIFIGTLVRD